MNWTDLAQEYLSRRRQLGYALISEGRYILNFTAFADQQSTHALTIALALDWANQAPSGSGMAISRRFCALRPFFRYAAQIMPNVAGLPMRYTGPSHRRLAPFIFSDALVLQLMKETKALIPKQGLRPITMQTLVGLLASSGLRPGEAVRLPQAAVNLSAGELDICDSKNWKRRIVPLSPSTLSALKKYQLIRDQFQPASNSTAFFLLDYGRALNIPAADYAFGLLRNNLGLNNIEGNRRPRLYDLRHTFVCKRVLSWYDAGMNVDSLMPQLSRYLGHKKVTDTYWYLSAIPELMARAASRFTAYAQTGGSHEHT